MHERLNATSLGQTYLQCGVIRTVGMIKFQCANRVCAPCTRRWYNRPRKNDTTKSSDTDDVERLHNLIKFRSFGNKDLYVAIANPYRSSDGTLCLSYPKPDPSNLSNSGASRRGPLSQLPTEQALALLLPSHHPHKHWALLRLSRQHNH